jgi:hypothetical protein
MGLAMLNYEVKGPTESGHYLVGYPTPGAPQVFTPTGCAKSEKIAKDECARLNEEQVAERREAMVRAANAIVRDEEC